MTRTIHSAARTRRPAAAAASLPFPAGGLILCAGALRESRLADDAFLALGCHGALAEEAMLLAAELALLPPGAPAIDALRRAGFETVPRIESFFQRLGALEAMERLGKLRIARLSELRAADGLQPVWLAGASLGNCWPGEDSGPVCSCMRLLANGLTGEPESLSLLMKKPSVLVDAESAWTSLTGGGHTGIPIALDMTTGTQATHDRLYEIIRREGDSIKGSLSAFIAEARCFGRRFPCPTGCAPCPGVRPFEGGGCAAYVFFDPAMQTDQLTAFSQHLASVQEAWIAGRIDWQQIPEATRQCFETPSARRPLVVNERAADEAAATFGFFGLAAPAELSVKKALDGWRRMAASWRGVAGRVSSLIRTLPDFASPKTGVRSGAGFIAFLSEAILSWLDHRRELEASLHGPYEPNLSTQELLALAQTLPARRMPDERFILFDPAEKHLAAAAALGLPGAFDSSERASALLGGAKIAWETIEKAGARAAAP